MTLQKIPVLKDSAGVVLPAFAVICKLGSTNFTIGFRWNIRESCWVMDVSDVNDTPILLSQRVTVGPVFCECPQTGGFFVAFDTTNKDLDPGLTDLGDRVIVAFGT